MNVMAEAIPVALEHIRYCRQCGMGALAILKAAEIILPPGSSPSWDDTVWLIARKWTMLVDHQRAA